MMGRLTENGEIIFDTDDNGKVYRWVPGFGNGSPGIMRRYTPGSKEATAPPTAKEIVSAVDRSHGKPRFYSGRGDSADDMSGEKMAKIQQLIKTHYGTEATTQFNNMVAGIQNFTMTSFMVSLYRLEDDGWVWKGGMDGPQHGRWQDDGYGSFARDGVNKHGYRLGASNTESKRSEIMKKLRIKPTTRRTRGNSDDKGSRKMDEMLMLRMSMEKEYLR